METQTKIDETISQNTPGPLFFLSVSWDFKSSADDNEHFLQLKLLQLVELKLQITETRLITFF